MKGNFHPSKIENQIYSLMEDYSIGTDVYSHKLTLKLVDWFNSLGLEFQLECAIDEDAEGGVCAVAFVDEGYPHLIMFDYTYNYVIEVE